MSTAVPKIFHGILLGMTTTLAKRLIRIRQDAGYGGHRQAAEFARHIGIRPPSLHNLESGASQSIGRALLGYLKIGANPDFILNGKGPSLLKRTEWSTEEDTLRDIYRELEGEARDTLMQVAKTLRRQNVSGPQ